MTSAPVDPASGDPVAATGLRWGIKESFLQYLRHMPGSQSSITGGANFTSKQRFHFPLATSDYDPATGQGTVRFGGDVRFAGHFGMLLVVFIDPWVTIAGDTGLLSIADPDYYPDSTRRLAMLDLDFSTSTPADADGVRWWPQVPGVLRAEAAEFFNNAYQVGQDFDPLDIRVPI